MEIVRLCCWTYRSLLESTSCLESTDGPLVAKYRTLQSCRILNSHTMEHNRPKHHHSQGQEPCRTENLTGSPAHRCSTPFPQSTSCIVYPALHTRVSFLHIEFDSRFCLVPGFPPPDNDTCCPSTSHVLSPPHLFRSVSSYRRVCPEFNCATSMKDNAGRSLTSSARLVRMTLGGGAIHTDS